MTQSEHNHVGEWRIPTAVVVLLILLCVAASSWGIWRWITKPTVNSDAVAVDPPTRGGGRRATIGEPPGRIFKRDDGSVRAVSGNYWVSVVPVSRQMTLYCTSGEQWLSNDQQMIFRLAQRWSRGSASLRTMQFTDEQKQQMKLVTAEPVLPLSDADKTRLDGLIKTWESAKDPAKPEAQRAVLLAMREIAKANLPAGKQAFVANLTKLNQLITPQQLDQFRQIETARRNNNNKPPATNLTRGA